MCVCARVYGKFGFHLKCGFTVPIPISAVLKSVQFQQTLCHSLLLVG